ncbi:hypothetical protein JCM10296v2_006125 [Rhodotorula toruloides]
MAKRSSDDGWPKAGRILSLAVSVITVAGAIIFSFRVMSESALSVATSKIDKSMAGLQKEIADSAKSVQAELRAELAQNFEKVSRRLDALAKDNAADRAERAAVGASAVQMGRRFADVADHVKALDNLVYTLASSSPPTQKPQLSKAEQPEAVLQQNGREESGGEVSVQEVTEESGGDISVQVTKAEKGT